MRSKKFIFTIKKDDSIGQLLLDYNGRKATLPVEKQYRGSEGWKTKNLTYISGELGFLSSNGVGKEEKKNTSRLANILYVKPLL